MVDSKIRNSHQLFKLDLCFSCRNTAIGFPDTLAKYNQNASVIEASEQFQFYAPAVGKVAQLHVEPGDSIKQGDTLVSLDSANIDNQIVAALRRIDLIGALLNRIAADSADRERKIVLETELKQWQEELSGLQKEKSQLQIKAPFDGVIAELESQLHQGRWVGENTRLGTLVSQEGSRIRGYVTASDLGRIHEGTQAVFIPDLPEQKRASGVISVVDTANAETLTIPDLTSHYDGPIAVNKVDNELEPLKSWYHISVAVDNDSEAVSTAVRGTLLAEGTRESLALRFWRRAVHVVLREVVI